MTDWTRFAEGLAEELAMLPDGALVVIKESGKPDNEYRYVQFRQTADLLEAQLTGDTYLDAAARPGHAGQRRLIDAGWQYPDSPHNENWWIELSWPLSTAVDRHLSDMVVIGLRDCFRIPDPDTLIYDAWNQTKGNRRLHMPLLGLNWEHVQ
ncbi:hypothetical protein OH799_18615 [Nocardia sp. NBC_00881]|uniref:TY-Chap domain-containing protein n=1 Tax=Nocardia sp. NBC_00881 TaxID=2975995 RepID=UPI003870367A|nr:hypothetical protein OH799_18615 [Nocardia sp. NBC_00881]